MSGKLKRKSFMITGIGIITLVLLGLFLTMMQTNLSIKSQERDMQIKIQQMEGLLGSAHEAAAQATISYDDAYQAKAASLAYMIQKSDADELTDERMQELKELLNVDNTLIVTTEGQVIAKAQNTPADFTQSRYNQLRTVFGTGEVSEPFEVIKEGECFRYFGAKIDYDTMAVIEHNPAELKQLLEDTAAWKSVLGNVSVGLEGYAFAVSSKDYTFLYHPNEDLIGQDALDAGILVDDLEQGNFTWMEVYSERLFCGTAKGDDAYIICAVTEDEIKASRNITVAIVLFVYFTVMMTVILYGLLIMGDAERNGGGDPDNYRILGHFYYDKLIGRKAGTLAAVGLMFILVISFYMQTLFALSRQSMSNDQHVMEVQTGLEKNAQEVKLLTEQYDRRYLNKCKTAAYILNHWPDLAARKDLTELSRALDVEFINIFDRNGIMTVTSSPYTNFRVSQDPQEQSYDFAKLLQGVEYVIQEAQPDEISGDYHQYIGVSLRDEQGNANGFVQIALAPVKMEAALANTKISSVLQGIKVGINGFAFAVNKEDATIAYHPDEKLTGRNVLESGMEEKQLRDEYSDYITLGNTRYFGSSLETDEYYVYVVVPERELDGHRLPIALASAGAGMGFLFLILLLLTFSRRSKETFKEAAGDSKSKEHSGQMIDVLMPDGTIRKTESAASRWANITIKWNEKTPEQRIFTVLRGLLSVFALAIGIAIVFKDHFMDSNSVFLYVISGRWERGINVFALTGCIMVICMVSAATMLLRKILKVLSKTLDARGETICRLISSFLKYISVIAQLYYCFALVGVDTATLLASAGILSLVIGLGAKTLVSDILAGLFIIFEGEFRVGDIVTIGDWRGTVLEIGVRTTKIEDGSKNIKIISNSDVNGVVNMTRRHSFASCDVGIEYGESLERVENILNSELPNIRHRLPSIQAGPFYKGVVSLGDNSVNIRIVAQCAESDRLQLARDLNREMKLLFDRFDISIPFPQIVLNQPVEFKQATGVERLRADRFNQEQKELSKELGNEEEQR